MTQDKSPGHDLPWAYRLRHSGPCEVVAVGGGQITVVPCGELRTRSLPVSQARKIDYPPEKEVRAARIPLPQRHQVSKGLTGSQ